MKQAMATMTKHNAKNSATCCEPPGSPGVSGSRPELGFGTMLPNSPPVGSVDVVSGVTDVVSGVTDVVSDVTDVVGESGRSCAPAGCKPIIATAVISVAAMHASLVADIPAVRGSTIGRLGCGGRLVVELGVENGR